MSIDGAKLFTTGLSALGVISGVVLKNTSKSFDDPKKKNMKILGTGLFIGGWATMAYSLRGTSWKSVKSVLAFVAILLIVIVVMTMVHTMDSGEEVPMVLPIVFAISWLVLGISVGILRDGRFDKWSAAAGAISSIMVILAMLVALPWQRKNCIVDGPGFSLFTAAFANLALINSLPGGISSIM